MLEVMIMRATLQRPDAEENCDYYSCSFEEEVSSCGESTDSIDSELQELYESFEDETLLASLNILETARQSLSLHDCSLYVGSHISMLQSNLLISQHAIQHGLTTEHSQNSCNFSPYTSLKMPPFPCLCIASSAFC